MTLVYSKGHRTPFLKDMIKDMIKDMDYKGHVSFIIEKIERICSAIYLLSETLSDKESMRWEMRKQATTLLSDIHVLKNTGLEERLRRLAHAQVLTALDGISSLLEMGSRAGIFSEMNRSLLSVELRTVRERIAWGGFGLPPEGSEGADPLFTSDFFTIHPSVPASTGSGDMHTRSKSTDTRFLSRTGKQPRKKPRLPFAVRVDAATAKRREKIMTYLERHGAATVADITQSAPLDTQVSEKTIQRDLADLVVQGGVAQEGKRRWSRYKATKQGISPGALLP